ncbi:MAG: integrin alpha [Candidatus Hodarchaeota archaeon]
MESNERFGCAPSEVGDVNNDGYDDIVIGQITEGIASLFFGRPSNQWKSNYSRGDADVILKTVINLSFCESLFYNDDWCFTGPAIGGNFNGDSYDDFIIMNSGWGNTDNSDKGAVMVFLGRSSEQWKEDSDVFNVNTTFIGENDRDRAGHGATGVGDVNNDGFSDFIFGDYLNEKTYLILGRPTEEWQTNYDFSESNGSFLGESSFTWSGFSVTGVGDTNMDGNDDFLIGAFERGNHLEKGYLILGRSSDRWTQNMPLDQSNASFIGEAGSDWFGWDISGAGDVDNNGLDDFLIGAPGYLFQSTRGKAYLFLSESLETTETSDYPQMFVLVFSISVIIILRKKQTR